VTFLFRIDTLLFAAAKPILSGFFGGGLLTISRTKSAIKGILGTDLAANARGCVSEYEQDPRYIDH
jgi:hypothetical protein